MKSRIKNERGDMSFFSIFIILSFVLLYASVQINCINIRNAAKMELNNVSARIYADTFHSQREANLTSYMSDISLSTAYKNALRAGFTEGMRSRVKLTNDDYDVENIDLTFRQYSEKIIYRIVRHYIPDPNVWRVFPSNPKTRRTYRIPQYKILKVCKICTPTYVYIIKDQERSSL